MPKKIKSNNKTNKLKKPLSDKRIKIKMEYLDLLEEGILTYTMDDIYNGKADKSIRRNFINLIGLKIHHGHTLSEQQKKYLTDSLFKMVDGINGDKAFLLTKGSRWENSKASEIRVSLRVWYLFNIQRLTIENAIKHVASINNRSPATIREIYYRNKKSIEIEYKRIEVTNGIDGIKYNSSTMLTL